MKSKLIVATCLFILLNVFGGCSTSRVGTTVPEDKRIPIKEGEAGSGVWKAFEYSMTYQYSLNRQNIQSPGKISINGDIELTGGALDSLNIWVNMLDSGGRILDHKSVFMSGFRSSDVEPSFKVELDTPPGMDAMSFSHTATERRGRNR